MFKYIAMITLYQQLDDIYKVHLVEEYVLFSTLSKKHYCATITKSIVEHGLYSYQSSVDGQFTILSIPKGSYDRIEISCTSIEGNKQSN